MNTYRIQCSSSVDTVVTASEWIVRKLDPDGIYRCIGTGSEEECIEIVDRCEGNKPADSYVPVNGGYELKFDAAEAAEAAEAKSRQRDEYWIGFDLCCEGKPLSACQNEGQRRGWRGAIKASGYDGMSADQLERMGV